MPANSVMPSFDTAQLAAIYGMQEENVAKFMSFGDTNFDVYSAGNCTPTPARGCLTGGAMTMGTHAGYGKFVEAGTGGGAACYAYVFEDAAGWHSLETACVQNSGVIPFLGETDHVRVDSCARVHAAPSIAAAVVTCLPDGSDAQVDGGPEYVAGAGQPSMLWWHLAGTGWIAHQYLLDESEEPCLEPRCALPAPHCATGSQSSTTLFGVDRSSPTHVYDNFPLPPQSRWGWNNAAGFVGVALCSGGRIEEITAFVDTQLEARGFQFLGGTGCMGGGSLITQCWATGPNNRYGFTFGLSSPTNWMVGFRKA